MDVNVWNNHLWTVDETIDIYDPRIVASNWKKVLRPQSLTLGARVFSRESET